MDNIESHYNAIGSAAMENSDFSSNILVYAELDDGFISSSLFFRSKSDSIRYRKCSRDLKDKLIDLWCDWKKVPGSKEWRAIEFWIDGDQFSVDLKYPEQIDEKMPTLMRRPEVLKKYFGDASIDYSDKS